MLPVKSLIISSLGDPQLRCGQPLHQARRLPRGAQPERRGVQGRHLRHGSRVILFIRGKGHNFPKTSFHFRGLFFSVIFYPPLLD